MNWFQQMFGNDHDLNAQQMAVRTFVVFVIALIFLRLSGSRAFGMRMPMDNVMTILLGATLSRAITGASPFIPTIVAGAVIVVLYRFCAWVTTHSRAFGKIIKGSEKLLFAKGKLIKENMNAALVSEEDVKEETRINANADSFEKVESIYLERNGEMSIVKKEP